MRAETIIQSPCPRLREPRMLQQEQPRTELRRYQPKQAKAPKILLLNLNPLTMLPTPWLLQMLFKPHLRVMSRTLQCFLSLPEAPKLWLPVSATPNQIPNGMHIATERIDSSSC